MATISHLSLLLFFTLTLSVIAKLNLDAADHLAILTVPEDLGMGGEINRPENLCNTVGKSCEPRISKESFKVTRMVLKSQSLRGFFSPVIGQLSELKELSFPNNYLVDRIPTQIPGELLFLINLRILDLSSNMFSDDLNFLNYFLNLEKLSLNNNMFTGKVPVSLRSFRNLRFFNIYCNSFLKGPLPALKQKQVISISSELKKTYYKCLPKRYILAELKNSSTNQSSGSDGHSAHSQIEAPSNNHRMKIRKTTFFVILVVGVISVTIFPICVLLTMMIIIEIDRCKHEGVGLAKLGNGDVEDDVELGNSITSTKAWRFWTKSKKAPLTTTPLSHRPYINTEELAFLDNDEAVAALQVIGRGGCGEVYRKEVPNSLFKAIAIKKIMQPLKNAVMLTEEDTLLLNRIHQIISEIQTAGQIRHRNLLPLIAHVSKSTCHYLVYKFMQNGSLQDVIQQVHNGTRELDWVAMHRIAIGVAHGLEYLHTSITPRIVHRDLKPANILLDDNMEPLITDFGLAKFIPDTLTHMSSNVAGTLGFIAPEYFQTRQFTEKCDVYSYGLVLGFLLIGKLPSDEFFQHTSEMSMVRWMRMVVTSGNWKQAINPNLLGNGYEEQMLQVLNIACLCTHHDPQRRPTSKECRIMLSKINH